MGAAHSNSYLVLQIDRAGRLSPHSIPHEEGRSISQRVLYQRFTTPGRGGAFSYIDDGYVGACRATDAEVLDWYEPTDAPLAEVLERFEPTVFLGTLQQTNREPSRWTGPSDLEALIRYRATHGLFVACRSSPSDMPDLVGSFGIDFDDYPDAGVASFYGQDRRPVGAECHAISVGAIDLIRSPLAIERFLICFRSFLDRGLPILEELHAADSHRYSPIEAVKRIDLSYIGGCWPFKWANMGPYVCALKEAFGSRFRVWGKGWPEGISEGPLEGDAEYVRAVAESHVCLAFHEPSQVIGTPFATNERPFKLLATGACVVSDANPLLMTRFCDGEHLRFASSPEDMVRIVAELLGDAAQRERLAGAGCAHVLAHHTYGRRVARLLELVEQGVEPGRLYGSQAESMSDAA